MMPIIWVSILLLLSLIFTTKRRKFLWYSFILLILFSNPFISNYCLSKWEKKAVLIKKTKNYDIGIVLAGMVKLKTKPYDRVFFGEAADRLLHAIHLYKEGKIKKILISGGDNAIIGEKRSEAIELAKVFELCGVPKRDLIIEGESRNTNENAIETCKIIQEKYKTASCLLITSSFHMRRSEGCFKSQGLIFDSFPVDFRTGSLKLTPNQLIIPSAGAFKNWHLLIHEVLGYTVYLATGKSTWSLPEELEKIGSAPHQIKTTQTTILTDSVFTTGIEGPAMDSFGNLFVVNYEKEGTIGQVNTKTGIVSLLVELPNGSIGNGIRFNKKDEFFIADYVNHNILKIEPNTKNISIYAHNDSLNQPNDVAIMSNGILFASDPNWSNSTGNLWRIDTSGTFILLEENMGTTNGVEVNSDNNLLYVNESIQRKVWVYDLNEKGEISNKRLFFEFEDGGMDGMRCDEKGNLYIARYDKGEIAIISPQGLLIQLVKLHGQKPTNITFSKKGKKCFVTLQDKKWIETFDACYEGRKE